MQTKLTDEQLRDLHNNEDNRGRKSLYYIFGNKAFEKRPIGVWCLIRNVRGELTLVSQQDWTPEYRMRAVGVAIVTSETAFIIAPHDTVVAPWSPIKGGRDSVELITDVESLDAAQATDRILSKYSGVRHVDSDGKTQYYFIGSLAADFCRRYSHGGVGPGEWNLPTVAQLTIIFENIAEVNACFLTMEQPPMLIGWYWSSIAVANNGRCAWAVGMNLGGTNACHKSFDNYVRAVSAFQI